MYAIIETGGKQYRVEQGSVLKVEKLDAEVGDEVTLDVVMTGGDNIQIDDSAKDNTVKAKVIAHDKAKKVTVFKYKRKKRYRKKQGHRQPFTKLEITTIEAAN